MRVVIASDSYATVSSAQVGESLGQAWAELGAQVAVVPMGRAGAGLIQALADLTRAPIELVSVDGQPVTLVSAELGQRALIVVAPSPGCAPAEGGTAPAIDQQASSWPVGRALQVAIDAAAELPRGRGTRPLLVIDLGPGSIHDGGAGLLAALGAQADVPLDGGVAGLAGITRLDLDAVRDRIGDLELVLACPLDQTGWQLTGLRGITSVRGHAQGVFDPGLLLALDQSLLDLVAAADAPPSSATQAGSGAAGLGWAVQLLGGRVTSGPALCAELSGLERSIGAGDLVVTGAEQLDFGTMGGEVIGCVTALAETRLRPVIAIAGTNFISARELRSVGIESAYSIRDEAEPSAVPVEQDEIGRRASAIARSWTW